MASHLRQAANDEYFKRLVNNFYKIEFSHKDSKALRKMRSIFLLRAFVPLWQTVFSAKLRKKYCHLQSA